MNDFKKFTSIEKLSDIWMKAQRYDVGELELRSKIKLHGTNAAVRIVDGVATPQKRTADISIQSDNLGFALWASNITWKTDQDVIIYGEWAGPEVQKSDAVSKIPRKMFFPFGVLLLDADPENNYVIEPDLIKQFLPDDENIFVIPWFGDSNVIDSNDVETAKKLQSIVEEQVEKIGEEDPYIKEVFDISGAGEGLVVGPYSETGIVPQWWFNSYVFKAKSEAHRTQKTKSSASVKVEVPDSVKQFAEAFVTEARCQQMINEHCEGSMSPKMIGTFLKNINADIIKESTNELAGLDIEWKVVAKEINKRALAWFQEKNRV